MMRLEKRRCRHVRGTLHVREIFLAAACMVGGGVAAACAGEPDGMRYSGVNIAGAEFGKTVPGREGTDYFYPTPSTIDYFARTGMNTIRVPFRWERVQHALRGELDAAELAHIDATVAHATARGMNVVLDVHNFAANNGKLIGSPAVPVAALADLWGKLAAHYKGNRKVIFGLMNEPQGLPTETWLAATNATIDAVRRSGAANLVLVPGNGWSGAHSWLSRSYGTPNGDVMLGVVDPAGNYAYEVHQYLDANFSGTDPHCRDEDVGVAALTSFTAWARSHGKQAFLGEFGGGNDATCLGALDKMLRYMAENHDVWLGWTYWAAGPWPPSYFTSVQPVNGTAPPQTAILLKHVARTDPTSPK
jgi:endoglucanase